MEKTLVAALEIGSPSSGYAFSYDNNPKAYKYNKPWNSGKQITMKTTTAILLTPDKEFHSFGYEAENKFSLLTSGDQNRYYFFRNFAEVLYQKELTDESFLKEENGKQISVTTIFGMTIKYLTTCLLQEINGQRILEAIRWVIAVPNITNNVKTIITESTKKAGIDIDSPWVVSYIEAAFEGKKEELPLEDRKTEAYNKNAILFISRSKTDIGFTSSTRAEEEMKIDIQYVEAVGSDSPFDAFLHMLCKTLGKIDVNNWAKQNVYDSLELRREFDKKFNSLSLRDDSFFSFRVPLSLVDEKTEPLVQRGSIYFAAKDKVRIESQTTEEFFKGFNFMVEWLRRELRTNTKRHIRSIIVAGELSDNPYFQKKIRDAFNGRLVIFPVQNDTVVLRGAVALGHIKSYSIASELKLLGLETVDEFVDIMKLGTYKCFWNRVYLVGSFNIGKTTLAKLLVGDPIPEIRESTDGIWLYIGRAGMDLESKKWICIKKGTFLNAVVTSMLMTMNEEKDTIDLSKRIEEDKPKNEERKYSTDKRSNKKMKADQSKSQSKAGVSKDEQKPPLLPKPKKRLPGIEKRSKLQTDQQSHTVQIKAGLSADDIQNLIIKVVEKGDYKMKIVPFDLWDFGGQKDYYMTHQLFITNRGVYVVMFNGSIDIHKHVEELGYLPGQYGKPNTAVYLMHWVNSILTYCRKTKSGFPRITFVATHKDLLRKDDVEKCRQKHITNITALFREHPGKTHIQYDSLIFVNAKDPHDPEVEILKDELIRCAVNNPRWGEKMPTAWVPLELEIMEQAGRGVNILTRNQLEELNAQNKTMILNPNQLETFLKVLHSLGRILYFTDVHLRNYIVINPVYMIDVLRSIITHQQFWPGGEEFRDALKNLKNTGILSKDILFKIWSQEEFKHILPFKNYMVDMLQHLDIIVEPKRHDTSEKATHFLVPCMITNQNTTDFLQRWCTDKYSIHLAYKFVDSVIPPALTYRFLGSFLTMGNLENYRHKTMIFTDLAVVSIDAKHSVAVRAEGDRLVISLIHSAGKNEIVPTIASSVQECLTASIHRITEFYSLAMDDEQKSPDMTNLREYPFKIEFGVHCESTVTLFRSKLERPSICFFHHSKMPCSFDQIYKCSTHGKRHDVRSLKCWFADKIREDICSDRCTGVGTLLLERLPTDQHLMRLAQLLSIEECRQVAITLGLSLNEWDKLKYKHSEPNDLNFMALHKWKGSSTESTLRDLLDPLRQLYKSDTFTHKLCQATRAMELKTKLDQKILKKSPSSEELERVSNHIGASAMALGVELGLDAPQLEAIDVLHKRKLIQKTREILKQWKDSTSSPTVLVLAKALERIGKGGSLRELMD